MWNVTASFRYCQDPRPAQRADAVSIETYTNVTCPCPAGAGDITYEIHLPDKEEPLSYRNLNETPNATYLNASRCAEESVGDQTYSYCVNFFTTPGDVDGTELRVEVTPDPLLSVSSVSCVIIVFQGMYP